MQDPRQTVADERYGIDGKAPAEAFAAESPEQVSELLRTATADGRAVSPIGGRTMLGLGMPPERYDVALDLGGMADLVDYEPEDFTVTSQAGMPLARLQQTLAQHGQFVPLDAPEFERATLGGIVAVGRGGLRRAELGSPRDWLIGLRVARADGTQIRGGGRVVKNVSGYDLPKLYCGSLGTLGAIVEVSFKLRPLPSADRVVALAADSFEAALAAAAAVSRSVDGLNGIVAVSAEAAAFASQRGADGLASAALVLRASGLEASVDETVARAVSASGLAAAPIDAASAVETWQAIADAELSTAEGSCRLRLGARPASLAEAGTALAASLPRARPLLAAADSGLLLFDLPEADAADTASEIVDLRDAVAHLGAHVTVEEASPALKAEIDIWGDPGPGIRLMRNVKEAFDPNRTLNPGRYVGGI